MSRGTAQNLTDSISGSTVTASMADVINGPVNADVKEELEPEQMVVDVECIDNKGTLRKGGFVLRIPTNDELLEIERQKVLLAGGRPLTLFSVEAMSIFNDIATCGIMFRKGTLEDGLDPAPAWWYSDHKDLPLSLIAGLSGEIQAHSDRYFRPVSSTGEATKGRGYVTFTRQGIKGPLDPTR